MDVIITISGKLTIADDDLKSVRAQNMEEMATILHRYGKDVKTDVTALIPKGGLSLKERAANSNLLDILPDIKGDVASPAAKKATKTRRTRRVKKV